LDWKRSKRNTPFVLLNKESLQDKSISWQAKGLLAYLLSLPDDWQILVVDLANRSTNGKDSTASILNELIKAGYIERQKIKDEKNRFGGYDYTVFDSPKTESPKTDNPFTGNPKTESPKTGNSELLSTNLNNKPNTNNPKRKKKENAPTQKKIDFEDLQKEFLETKAELEKLKAESEKEKSCEKKEKANHEFPALNGRPKAELKPPRHKKDDLMDAWYSAEDSINLKPYQISVQAYHFNGWPKSLKEAFDVFCEGEYDNSKKKFGTPSSGSASSSDERKFALEAIQSGIDPNKVKQMYKQRTGMEFDL